MMSCTSCGDPLISPLTPASRQHYFTVKQVDLDEETWRSAKLQETHIGETLPTTTAARASPVDALWLKLGETKTGLWLKSDVEALKAGERELRGVQ